MLKVYFDCIFSISLAKQFEISLFMEQVREPTSLTAVGLVVMDKNLGLTVSSKLCYRHPGHSKHLIFVYSIEIQ